MKKLNITAGSNLLHVILKEEPELFVKTSYVNIADSAHQCLNLGVKVILKINGNEYMFKVRLQEQVAAKITDAYKDVVCDRIAIDIFKAIFKSLENDKEEEEICLDFFIPFTINKIIK